MNTQCDRKLPKWLYLFLLTWMMGMQALAARADSITAAPDGTGTLIHHNGNTYKIDGGIQAGANLFHSFQEFGLNPQEIADFLSNPSINNIVGRVTGGNPSIVQGLIQLSGGNSNLFLMNPAGWVFTQGASLDVPGSFGATTATRIGFGDDYFNAYGDNNYSELIGNPTSLIFDQNNPSWIVNEADLAVSAGESLWLVGGGIISTGTVEAEGGNITLAAVPEKSQVRLSHEGMVVNLVLDAAPVEGSITIPGNSMGIRAVDIPRYLTGGNEVGHANEAIVNPDGTVQLVRSDTAINEGDTVIAGKVNGENITLMAAGRVNAIENGLIENNPTVVLFPDAIGDTVETSFIDEGVEDYQTLLYGGKSGTISQVVTHQENGIHFVTDTLTEIAAQGGEVSAVHLLNEGNEGEFWLGNAYVSNETISQYQAQLEQWGIALTPEADILLYACYTALGGDGIELVNTLAGLTGADVAASTNLTGNAAVGGDWNLEVQTGSIEAGLGLEQWAMDDFTGKLVVFTASDAASLIAHITTANGNAVTDTINLAGDITLTAIDNAVDGANGLPSITAAEKLTINGMGNTLSRDATAPGFRLLQVALGAELEIKETTLSGGLANSAGAFGPGNNGGAIFNRGVLTVTDSTVSGNEAMDSGGGIYSFGESATNAVATITNSLISGNTAGSGGGGIANVAYTAGFTAIPGAATMTITNSLITGNQANTGGGISNLGQRVDNGAVMLVTNSTISGNTAVFAGGGLYNRGQSASQGATITVTNSTITQNTVTVATGRAGGVQNTGLFGGAGTGVVLVGNSIIAENTSAGTAIDVGQSTPAANAPFTDLGNNLIGADSTGTFTTSTLVGTTGSPLDPQLLPLGDYGGSTQTHGILPSSPAFDAGDSASTTVTTDQRGAPGQRIVGGAVDIGAFEFQGSFEIVAIGDQNLTVDSFPSTLDVSVKVVEAVFNLLPSVGATVDFSPVGEVTGSFTNGASVITDADGMALNFFTASSGTGDFQILAASTGVDSFSFNITNNTPAVTTNTTNVVAAIVANLNLPSDIEANLNLHSDIEQILESLEVPRASVLLGRGCASTPENAIQPVNDGRESGLETENTKTSEAGATTSSYDNSCNPIDGGGGGDDS